MWSDPHGAPKAREGWHKIQEGAEEIKEGVYEAGGAARNRVARDVHDQALHVKHVLGEAQQQAKAKGQQISQDTEEQWHRAQGQAKAQADALKRDAHQLRKQADRQADQATETLVQGKRGLSWLWSDVQYVLQEQMGKFRDVGSRLTGGWLGDTATRPSSTDFSGPSVMGQTKLTPPIRDNVCSLEVQGDNTLSLLLDLDRHSSTLLGDKDCLYTYRPIAVVPGQPQGYGRPASTRLLSDLFAQEGKSAEQVQALAEAWRQVILTLKNEFLTGWTSLFTNSPVDFPYTLYLRPDDGTADRDTLVAPDDASAQHAFHRVVLYDQSLTQLDIDLNLLHRQIKDTEDPWRLAQAVTAHPLQVWARGAKDKRPHLLESPAEGLAADSPFVRAWDTVAQRVHQLKESLLHRSQELRDQTRDRVDDDAQDMEYEMLDEMGSAGEYLAQWGKYAKDRLAKGHEKTEEQLDRLGEVAKENWEDQWAYIQDSVRSSSEEAKDRLRTEWDHQREQAGEQLHRLGQSSKDKAEFVEAQAGAKWDLGRSKADSFQSQLNNEWARGQGKAEEQWHQWDQSAKDAAASAKAQLANKWAKDQHQAKDYVANWGETAKDTAEHAKDRVAEGLERGPQQVHSQLSYWNDVVKDNAQHAKTEAKKQWAHGREQVADTVQLAKDEARQLGDTGYGRLQALEHLVAERMKGAHGAVVDRMAANWPRQETVNSSASLPMPETAKAGRIAAPATPFYTVSWTELVGGLLVLWVMFNLWRTTAHRWGRQLHSHLATRVSGPSGMASHASTRSSTTGASHGLRQRRSTTRASDGDTQTDEEERSSAHVVPHAVSRVTAQAAAANTDTLGDIITHLPVMLLLVGVLELNHCSQWFVGYLLLTFGIGAALHFYQDPIAHSSSALAKAGKVLMTKNHQGGLYLMWSAIVFAGGVNLIQAMAA
ncbi:hypothetical protein H4R34_001024 [Dimargaris verticillata]|uniref:Uncharacterized protein n=1 Tax=Dimargaris verticillata TaxID=2761393 RepID=A0A9W8B9A1_9FUNG|nr:hypothetical protein H4R34_001024 [Dimargaris verticillata]